MTKQAKSAKSVYQSWLENGRGESYPDYFNGHEKAESELIPIINQQAEEIETLKAELSAKNTALGIDKEKILESMLELEKEKDALKEEIEKLKGQGVTTLNDYREEVKMRLEAQTERDNLLQEIERLKVENAKISAFGDTANQFYMEEVKKVSALQSRFDELEHEYKNFHRNLCKRFDFYHDNVEWRGYLASLEEHIAKKLVRFDELVKSLEGLPVSMIDTHPVKMFNDDDKEPFIHKPFIDEIISQAKGQANG